MERLPIVEQLRDTDSTEVYNRLNEKYNFKQSLGLSKYEGEVFALYTLGYLILTSNRDVRTSLASIERFKNLPIIKQYWNFAQKIEDTRKEMAKNVFNEADKKGLIILNGYIDYTYKTLSKNTGYPIEKIKMELPTDHPDMIKTIETINLYHFSAPEMRRIANLVVSNFRIYQTKDPDIQKEEMDKLFSKFLEERKKARVRTNNA